MNNVVGKMLVVMNLVFCLLLLCFAGAVYTYSGQWRDKANDLQSKLDNANNQVKEAVAQRNLEVADLNAKLKGMTTERDNLQATLTQNADQVKTFRDLEADARQRAEKSASEALIASDEQAARIVEAGVLNAEVQKQSDRIATLFGQVQDAEAKILEQKGQLAEAKEKEEQSLAENARLRDLLRANSIDPRQTLLIALPEEEIDVDGYVEETTESQTGELFRISIGSDDKIYEDMELTVSRGRKYVGKARVVRVEPDTAVCIMIRETRQDQVRKGDRVTTKL